MMNEDTRLDHAMMLLKAYDQHSEDVQRWTAMSAAISGIELTGAPDDVRQAIESFGVSCNTVMQPYRTDPAEGPANGEQTNWDYSQWEPADVSKLVELSRELAVFIRDAETARIFDRLRQHDGVFPDDEIIEARRHRDWFTSALLHECQAAVDDHIERNGKDTEHHSSIPFFSLFLFSEWNVTDSVPVILSALTLPDDGPFEMFGDGVHEQAAQYIAQFLSSEPDRIDELIRNRDVNLYVRWASASSYKYLVRDGAVSSDDAVDRLDRLFDEIKVADEDGRPGLGHEYELSAGILDVILSIGGAPRSKISDSKQDWDFVDESIIRREEFAEAALSNETDELGDLPPTRIEDCIETLSWWAAFAPGRKRSPSPPATRPADRPKPRFNQPGNQNPPPPKLATKKTSDRVPRNAKCPCGSGKKYKQCCLRQA